VRGCFWLNGLAEWEMTCATLWVLGKESGGGGDENDGFVLFMSDSINESQSLFTN
jgi:hypothetical protein